MNVALYPTTPLEAAGVRRANPLAMNLPPYFTIPAGSELVTGDHPCLKMKPHLRQIIELVAGRYGAHTSLRVLAGNVIGTGGWKNLGTRRQHEFVTTRAGAFIASGMMYLEVSGRQAVDVLDHLTPRDLTKLKTGRAVFTLFTTPTGGVDEEALVLRLADDRYLVSCGGGSAPSYLHEALALFPDASVSDTDYVSFNIKGPDRREVMRDLIAEPDRAAIDALKPFASCRCRTTGGAQVVVVRSIIGMEMWGLPEAITPVWQAILDMPDRVLPCGWDLLDTYRMECSEIDFLLHPLDMNYGTRLPEIGLGWMIDRSKERDYVGRASLQCPVHAPEIRVRKMAADANRPDRPQIGELVRDTAGRVRGHVSSWGYSYAADRYVAFIHLAVDPAGDEGDLDGWHAFGAEPRVEAAE